MKSKYFAFGLVLSACVPSIAQVTDIENNTYDVCQIGEMKIMSQNLNVSTFSNGDPIKEAKSKKEWIQADQNHEPAWCYYNFDEKYGEIYGKLYNGYAVRDSRRLAPEGWHIPKMKEWRNILKELGGKKEAGQQIKSKSGWVDNGNNKSGFNGLPGGHIRDYILWKDSFFSKLGEVGTWWSSTRANEYTLGYILLHNDTKARSAVTEVERYNALYYEGKSVRCIKD